MFPNATLSTIRSNGVRLITAPIPSSELTTSVIAVRSGTRGERPSERGISHLVEHQVFKGSRRYASPVELNAALASVGAYYNASTNMELTYYVVTSPRKHALEAFDIVSDIVLHPRIPASEFSREKRVVFEETLSAHQDDEHYVEILLEDMLYQHQPLGWDILGTVRTMRNAGRKETLAYIKKWYAGRRMAFAFIGGGDLHALRRHAANACGTLPKGRALSWKPFVRKSGGARVRHLMKDERQTTMLYGVPGVPIGSPLGIPQELLRQVLGGATSSRLYDRIREEKGLVYDISADCEYYSDAGHIQVYTQTGEKQAGRVLGLIQEECRRIVGSPVTARELSTAKEVLDGSLDMLAESQESLAVHYAKGVLLGKGLIQMGEMRRRIHGVELGTVRALAARTFAHAPWYLASIGRRDPVRLQ